MTDSEERDETAETLSRVSAVSRETLAAFFGERGDTALEYADLLATEGVIRGLIGPREAERLWDRHLLNCVAIAELIGDGWDVVDVGSGAGLPGIPLAIARPDLLVTLVEPMARRMTFLEEVCETLGMTNVRLVRARAEDVVPRGKADVVISRAVAPLDRLVRWCLPLTRRGGQMLAIKGATASDELRKHANAVARAGGSRVGVVECGSKRLSVPTTVIRVHRR